MSMRGARSAALTRRILGPAGRGRRGRLVTALVLLALVGGVLGGLVQVRIDTGTESFLPAGDPAYEQLEDKARSFGGDPVVVLLESRMPRQLLTDQDQLMRLLGLEGTLARLPDTAAVYGPATILNQTAASIQNFLAQISGQRDGLRKVAEEKARREGLSGDAVTKAGRDAVADFDARYGALLVKGLPAGLPTLRNPQFVTSVVFDEGGTPRPQWRYVLPDERTAAVLVRPREGLDQAAAGRLSDEVRAAVDRAGLNAKVTVTGVPVVTAGLSERAQQEMPVLGALAVVAVGAVFLLLPWTRGRTARLRPLGAAVAGTALTLAVFGWLDHPLSLGVVAFLPILMGIGSDYPYYLAQPGHRRRILVAAAAGAVAFASLALSPLPFVRELGVALALGIVLTVGVALAARRFLWPEAVDVAEEPDADPGPRARPWVRVAALVAAAGIAGAGWAALPGMGIEARPDQLARGLPELDQARHAEDVLGSSGELSVVLRGGNVLTPEALAWTRKAQDTLVREHGDELHPIVTLADLTRFLGKEPTADQISAAMRLLPSYLSSAVVRPDGATALMTFGVELRDLERQRALLAAIREDLPSPPAGLEADVVGLPVAAVRGLDLVSGGRSLINVVGILLAAAVLAVGLRRGGEVLRAVATVLLATGWVLALAWLVLGTLNPLTVAIGSLTTATGCEFAVMLANKGRRAVRTVGTAALAATVGYAALALSGLALLREFGLLLAASVALSFVAAVLLRAVWPAPRSRPSVASESAHPRKVVSV